MSEVTSKQIEDAKIYYLIRFRQRPWKIRFWRDNMVEFLALDGMTTHYAMPETIRTTMEEYYDKNSKGDGRGADKAI